MLEILRRLNTGVGVRGSMIVTSEGIVVAADLGGELEEERVAAMASSV
ncbi:MAG: roadblock/LC7 domain-containing protein, partial [Planctomycetota bacterium]